MHHCGGLALLVGSEIRARCITRGIGKLGFTYIHYWCYVWQRPCGRKWGRTKEPLDESERGEWNVVLKLNIQKTKIKASSPITSWQIDGETVETMADFLFLSSKITAGGDCSHDIKRCLLLGRKVITNLDSILKSRDITLPTKVRRSRAMVFSSGRVWMWELDIKKVEHRRIDAFELWC